MFDEERIWAAAKATPGVVVNTLKQITKVYRPSLAARAYFERAKSIERINTWARKRFLHWEPVFGALGYDKVTTTALAESLGRGNSSVMKDLGNLITDGLVIRDGVKPHLGEQSFRRKVQQWTWIGERNAKH